MRIPAGVAHDNWGRQDIHLLFYVDASVEDQLPGVRRSEPHSFKDWEPAVVQERLTGAMGGAGQMVDERVLLAHVERDSRRLQVLHPTDDSDLDQWVWKSDAAWFGLTRHGAGEATTYRRHRNAHEAQYQVSGRRTLITQLGTVELEPGDFVHIPAGCAFGEASTEPVSYLRIATVAKLERVGEPSKTAQRRERRVNA